MSNFIWGLIIDFLFLMSTLALGKKKRIGWQINNLAMFLWIFWAIQLQAWSIIITSIIFMVVNTRNWMKWEE